MTQVKTKRLSFQGLSNFGAGPPRPQCAGHCRK